MILKVQIILTKVVNRMIKKYQPKLHDFLHPHALHDLKES